MSILQISWDVSPEIFGVGSVAVRWYGLFWAMSFYLGYEIMFRIFKREGIPLNQVDKLLLYMAAGSIIGARLGHCFFYDFDYYSRNPLEILMIWRGGLASHGGAAGILLALYYYQKKVSNQSFWWLLDRLVIPVALGAFFIRMGNLMNSEIYGIETSLPWGFIFEARGEILPKHPTQIYEGLTYLLLFIALGWMYLKRFAGMKNGFMAAFFAIVMFSARFLVEFIKMDQSEFEAGMALNMGQWLSIPLFVFGVYMLIKSWPSRERQSV